jgi:hypothetical protein
MIRVLVAMLLLSATGAHADWIDAMLHDLARTTAPPHARYTTSTHGSAGMLSYTRRETRTAPRPVKGKIIAIAVSSFGNVAGQVLRPGNGAVVCEFTGVYDGTCLTLDGCVYGTRCN